MEIYTPTIKPGLVDFYSWGIQIIAIIRSVAILRIPATHNPLVFDVNNRDFSKVVTIW
jgi:hypothetical protein